jgi:hypothetical protein
MVHSPYALFEHLESEAENEKQRGIFRWDALLQTTALLVARAPGL